jgi:hypothetical protein
MQEQNYKNHRRLSLSYHGITGLALLILLVGAIRNVILSDRDSLYNASLILLIVIILISIFFHARIFGLKAQDRAIRAEENFRHYLVTGKQFDPRLRMSQIIALRFASDEELPALAQKAVEEKLSNKQIKQEIRNWRGDHYRV